MRFGVRVWIRVKVRITLCVRVRIRELALALQLCCTRFAVNDPVTVRISVSDGIQKRCGLVQCELGSVKPT